MSDGGIVPLICPTCQNAFDAIAQSIDHAATLHGVVFDILVGLAGPAVARSPEARLRPMGFGAAAFAAMWLAEPKLA
ncbi:hypothetical protein CQ14_29425 [Bradyrhizobium lablabi]|uniref:C2H2-type domain-containing protein n=1 Tax=Bradyrhizobium lablabi TaxID=722472 RepID=A0A0R3N6X5_9BRAD|nr:hypothetical protein [Bradyrhizobium lablabi]KRR27756.1 hypothetical protein CQ14_29425 [Bradyrhizobium lablabi]